MNLPGSSGIQELFGFLRQGTVKADVRARWENARIDDVKVSNALTLRTRLGYGTRPWHGLSAFAEFENIASPDGALYFDGVGANPRGRTIVADPTVTELNQAFGDLSLDEVSGLADTETRIRAGRQRIKLDDDRFIGNVGWRQNEQTYDAVEAGSSLGVEGLTALYTYSWEVHRIFGDLGAGREGTRDFGSDAHLVNIRYDGFSLLQPTLFGYFLDFEDHPAAGAPANSSTTADPSVCGMHTASSRRSFPSASRGESSSTSSGRTRGPGGARSSTPASGARSSST